MGKEGGYASAKIEDMQPHRPKIYTCYDAVEETNEKQIEGSYYWSCTVVPMEMPRVGGGRRVS